MLVILYAVICRHGINTDSKERCIVYNALDFFRLISTDSTAETLLKAGQYELLRMFCAGKGYEIKRTWPTIKICMRNNYVVKDASMWFDYLDLLGDEGKDLRNAHYVCPDNLNSAHDFYIERKRRKEE